MRKRRPSRGLFIETLWVQSHSGRVERMIAHVVATARRYGAQVEVKDGNVYATKGRADLYPCIVAHTDTVHRIVPDDEYHLAYDGAHDELWFAYNPKTRCFTGVGGDDKVGVFVALDMLRTHKVVKAAFFRDEENGCQGARHGDLDFFVDCAFVLECDRRGSRAFVDTLRRPLF